MNTTKISRTLNANKLNKQQGFHSGYSLNGLEDRVEVHYFSYRADLVNERLNQISQLLADVGFNTQIIAGSGNTIHKVVVTES